MKISRLITAVLKIIAASVSLLIMLIVLSVIWPLPNISPPSSPKAILIKSVNIIDVKTGRVHAAQDVVLAGNRIKSITTSGIAYLDRDIFTINAEGKYLLPGLWDMHSHSTQHSPWMEHPLFIANGVTGVRELSGQLNKKDSYWAGSRERLQWQRELENNLRVSPRFIYQSSFQLDGASSVPDSFDSFFKLQKTQDVTALLDFYKSEEVDLLKVYYELKPEVYRELAMQAPRYGMHLAGHKPMFVELEEAIQLGQRSFEHGRIFLFEYSPIADQLRNSSDYREIYAESKQQIVDECDDQKVDKLMTLMSQHQAYWTPTLQTVKVSAYAEQPKFIENANRKYITTLRLKLLWDPDIGRAARDNIASEKSNTNLNFYDAVKQQVALASEKGVFILAGTDVTDSNVFPGFSLHSELSDLVESGLTPLQALQSATIVAANYAQLSKDLGSIEAGKLADLVLLKENPLENISNTKTIEAVFINGVYYDQETLNGLKNVVEELASSMHMNVKFIISLLASPLMRNQFAD